MIVKKYLTLKRWLRVAWFLKIRSFSSGIRFLIQKEKSKHKNCRKINRVSKVITGRKVKRPGHQACFTASLRSAFFIADDILPAHLPVRHDQCHLPLPELGEENVADFFNTQRRNFLMQP